MTANARGLTYGGIPRNLLFTKGRKSYDCDENCNLFDKFDDTCKERLISKESTERPRPRLIQVNVVLSSGDVDRVQI